VATSHLPVICVFGAQRSIHHAGYHLGGKTCNVLPEPNCRELVLPNLTRSICTTSPGLLPSFLPERILLALCSVSAIGCHLEIGLATIRATPRRQPTGPLSVLPSAHLQRHSSPATRPAEPPARRVPTFTRPVCSSSLVQIVRELRDDASWLASFQVITTAYLRQKSAAST
jgi:hypothetical protein